MDVQKSSGSGRYRRAWALRTPGDRRIHPRLSFVEDSGVVVLNDRRVPGSRQSVRLIAVSSSGVFVVDTKEMKGLVQTRRSGTMTELGDLELHVGRRDCTALVERVADHAAAVGQAIDIESWAPDVPLQGVLCLSKASWGIASAIEVGRVWVGWPQLIVGHIQRPGALDPSMVRAVSNQIAKALPRH